MNGRAGGFVEGWLNRRTDGYKDSQDPNND